MWPFRKPVDVTAIIAKIAAEEMADPINDDALFYEWCLGPGESYPTETRMMREIEGAPLKPCEMWVDGWDKAFYAWAADRRRSDPVRGVAARRATSNGVTLLRS